MAKNIIVSAMVGSCKPSEVTENRYVGFREMTLYNYLEYIPEARLIEFTPSGACHKFMHVFQSCFAMIYMLLAESLYVSSWSHDHHPTVDHVVELVQSDLFKETPFIILVCSQNGTQLNSRGIIHILLN